MNYEKLYYFLFNGITDIISLMEKQDNNDIQDYVFMLKKLQSDSEEKYIENN